MSEGAGGRVALGLSVHTGWAACVVAGGGLRAPRIALREEIEMLGDPARFVFHRASELPRAEAKGAIDAATASVAAQARAEIDRVVSKARADGLDVVACAVVAQTAAMPASLDAILDAHPRIHTAEGCLYRDALVAAAKGAELDVQVVAPRELEARAAKAAGLVPAGVAKALASAGKIAGRPWAKDQKDAALAAWIALAEAR